MSTTNRLSLVTCAAIYALSCSEKPKDPFIPSYTSRGSEGQVGCLSRAEFPALDKANLTAKVAMIKTGSTIAGVAGTLINCATDNGVTCTSSAEFPAVVKSTITADAIVSGKSLVGTLGTFAPACTADAAVSCLSTEAFKSVNTTGMNPWDLRAGKTFAGVTGSLSFYTNAANLMTFNRITGAASNASLTEADVYDTINDIDPIPVLMPPGGAPVVSNWVREATSDTNNDQTCDGMEVCIFSDLLTGLSWHEDDGTLNLWEDAIGRCEDLVVGALNDWRLPTQKELLGAYVNRIYSLRAPLNLGTVGYISATTASLLTTNAWNVTLARGLSISRAKASDTDRVLCVR